MTTDTPVRSFLRRVNGLAGNLNEGQKPSRIDSYGRCPPKGIGSTKLRNVKGAIWSLQCDFGALGTVTGVPSGKGESKLSEEEALITRWRILQYDLVWQSLLDER